MKPWRREGSGDERGTTATPGEAAHVMDGRRRFDVVQGRLASLPDTAHVTSAAQIHTRVARWYEAMVPCWIDVQPTLRRRLLLRVHLWIVDSAVVNGVVRSDVLDDLGPGGALATALCTMIPPGQAALWRPWIRLVLHDLRRALRWPPARQTEAWWRWLFLIPYGVPHRDAASPGTLTSTDPA